MVLTTKSDIRFIPASLPVSQIALIVLYQRQKFFRRRHSVAIA
jgi:hypothetical protein